MGYKRRTLEYQSDTIEAVLAKHKVGGRVSGGTVTPKLIKFRLAAQIGTKVSKVSALAEEIALALGARETRIYRQGSEISVEVPRVNPTPTKFLPLCNQVTAQMPPHTCVLGVDENGVPLLLRVNSPDVAHVLVAGTTGSGKTALTRSLLTSLAMFNRQSDLQILLIDPKGRGFGPLSSLPHVLGKTASTPEEAGTRLRWLISEMERRDKTSAETGRQDFPVLVVAIDELADLLQTGGKPIERMLTRLTQRGREAGIHLIACTQKPTASQIGSGMTANFPIRLVGAVASKAEARYATGVSDSGAEKLGGKGDFLLISRGESVRFQSAWMSGQDLRAVVKTLVDGGSKRENWS